MPDRHLILHAPASTFPSRCILGFENNASQAHWGPGVRDAWILHFVISGKGFFNEKPVFAGQGFVLPPGMLHEYHAAPQDGWNYFWMILPDAHPEAFLKEYGIFEDTPFFRFNFPPHFMPLYTDYLTQHPSSPDPAQNLSLMLLLLSSIEKEQPPAAADRSQLHVRQAMEYIRLHYHQKLTVSALAQALFLDPGYLYNLFIRHLGLSPKACLNRIRLEKACELLKRSDLLISEIGRSVGYDDVLQFSRFFKSHLGLSPNHYRKKEHSKPD